MRVDECEAIFKNLENIHEIFAVNLQTRIRCR